MSEKQVIVTLEDGFGRVQTSIATSLSAPQLMDKIIGIADQQATIQSLKEENEKLGNIHLSIDLNYNYGYGKYLADVRVIDSE